MPFKKPIYAAAITVVVSLFFTCLMYGAGQAQSYPKKPIEVIVPASPGGGLDAGARIIASHLSTKWNVPVTVVNKPGGQSIPGTLDAMKASPDGYTMMADGHSTNTMQSAAMKDLPPELSVRTSIAKVFMVPVFFVVKTDAPWKTLAEVIEYARKNPKALKWAAGTLSSINNFSQTLLFRSAGIDPEAGRVIFDKGHGAAFTATIGGHVQFGIGMMPDVKSLHPTKIRALAVTSQERINIFPDIPTTGEAGFPQANLVGWYGISGPPKLPSDIVNLWVKTLGDAASNPEFQEKAAKVGHLIRFVGHKEMEIELKGEYKIYLEIAERTGIRK